MKDQVQSYRGEFIEEKKKHGNTVLDEAQRLVNLYRHANAFGENFSAQLDEMLLSASPEVQMALSDILGGQVVRQYCTYLKERTTPQDNKEQSNQETDVLGKRLGYLPEPEDETSISSQGNSKEIEALFKTVLTAHQQELSELIKAQSENLTALLGRSNQEGYEKTSYPTTRFKNTVEQDKGKRYADVIEAVPQTPVFVPDETEGF